MYKEDRKNGQLRNIEHDHDVRMFFFICLNIEPNCNQTTWKRVQKGTDFRIFDQFNIGWFPWLTENTLQANAWREIKPEKSLWIIHAVSIRRHERHCTANSTTNNSKKIPSSSTLMFIVIRWIVVLTFRNSLLYLEEYLCCLSFYCFFFFQ